MSPVATSKSNCATPPTEREREKGMKEGRK